MADLNGEFRIMAPHLTRKPSGGSNSTDECMKESGPMGKGCSKQASATVIYEDGDEVRFCLNHTIGELNARPGKIGTIEVD